MVRDGIRGSIAGVNSEGRKFINMHGSPVMVPTMSRWPPVGGHPAMVGAIEVQLGRAQERSAWEGGVKGARLLFWRCLVAFPCFLLLCLVPALSDEAWAGVGAGAGG